MEISEAAKEARRKYDRAYYASHKEQAREKARRCWERKAARLAAEKAAMEIDTQNEPEKKTSAGLSTPRETASGGLRRKRLMATFIRVRDNDREIRYVNRDYIDTFAYDRAYNKTRISFVGNMHGYLEIDGDITDLILNPENQKG